MEIEDYMALAFHPESADKMRKARRQAFIERTGAILDCDPSDADKLTARYESDSEAWQETSPSLDIRRSR